MTHFACLVCSLNDITANNLANGFIGEHKQVKQRSRQKQRQS